MKHVLSREQAISESLGTGSIIFVKGVAEDDKKKLYATHVKGYTALKGGAIMYFLAKDFYRIVKEEDSLRPVKVNFRNEDQLKKALSIKQDGDIVSIVGHWNKTPWHKESVKHTRIEAALSDLKSRILGTDQLLLESTQALPTFDEAYVMATTDIIETLFFGKKSVDILNYTVDAGISEAIGFAQEEELQSTDAEWTIKLTVLFLDEKYDPFIKVGALNRTETVTLFMKSNISLVYSHYPGDYYTPTYSDVDGMVDKSEIEQLYIDDSALDADELGPALTKLIEDTNLRISKKDDTEIEKMVNATTRKNWYAKFF
jgi:hypothetical protein